MEKGNRAAAAAAWVALAFVSGCSKGGGAASAGHITTSNLAVTSHDPAADQLQVPPAGEVRLQLDGPIVPETLQRPESGLFDRGGQRVAGSFRIEDGGRTITFVPEKPLGQQDDCEFRLSPFTADTSGRLLDHLFSFRFRTLDDLPPVVTGSSVAEGETGVGRATAIDVDFDEELRGASISPASVQLRDASGAVQSTVVTVDGSRIQLVPMPDLVGGQRYTLALAGGPTGIADRVGNSLRDSWSVHFKTAADDTPPLLTSSWPSGAGASPRVQPRLRFDESVDPASVHGASVLLTDGNGDPVPYDVAPSIDQRTIRLVPRTALTPGDRHTVTVRGGPGGITDLSGNEIAQTRVTTFVTGADVSGPSLVSAVPDNGENRASMHTQPVIEFDEAVEPTTVSTATVELFDGGTPIPIVVALEDADTAMRVQPLAALAPGHEHVLRIAAGAGGVLDRAGNPLADDILVTFRTSTDPTDPTVILGPTPGHGSVPVSARATAVFDSPMDPASIDSRTVFVATPWGTPVAGTLTLSRSNRVVRFEPNSPWTAQATYTFTILGGPAGVREQTGNWLAADQTSRFRTSTGGDLIAPSVSITLNDTDDTRKATMSVPPSGFDLDVTAADPMDRSLDMSSIEVSIRGDGTVPGSEQIFAGAVIDRDSLRYRFDSSSPLQPGSYTATARIRDLSGNLAISSPLDFQVRELDSDAMPFERTQVVWVRFDLDRNHNGRADLLDDLLRLGLATAEDSAGTNQYMMSVVRGGILGYSHHLLGRGVTGDPLDQDAVSLRLTDTRPFGIVHSQIACAGLDPDGDPARSYGARSTGTLGRAWFDGRNANMHDSNVGTGPGLGVFPGELFLFESALHIQVGAAFATTFSRTFVNICPQMGGVPAGSHPLDAVVLRPSFDFDRATPAEQARYDIVFSAADEWATAIGTILAHEIGHSVGLVASGDNPRGLHGDSTLHNEFSGSMDVMAPALGYDSLVFLDYRFRDLNTAYLRQRLLMK